MPSEQARDPKILAYAEYRSQRSSPTIIIIYFLLKVKWPFRSASIFPFYYIIFYIKCQAGRSYAYRSARKAFFFYYTIIKFACQIIYACRETHKSFLQLFRANYRRVTLCLLSKPLSHMLRTDRPPLGVYGKIGRIWKVARSLENFAYGMCDRENGPCLPQAAR